MDPNIHRSPYFSAIDQGSAYTSREMTENLEETEINLGQARIRSPERIGIVERFNVPLKPSLEKIRSECGRDT